MKKQVYGVSSKFNFGKWEHVVYRFLDQEVADKWLDTEEYDFKQRELMSKTDAIRLAGRNAVENALEVM